MLPSVLALDAQLAADARAGAEEDGVVALREEVVDRDVVADAGVADELDAELLEVLDLVVEDLFLHLEVGDAVEEDAAGLGPGLEDGARRGPPCASSSATARPAGPEPTMRDLACRCRAR